MLNAFLNRFKKKETGQTAPAAKREAGKSGADSVMVGEAVASAMQRFYDAPGKERILELSDALIAALTGEKVMIAVPADAKLLAEKEREPYLKLWQEQFGGSYKAYTSLGHHHSAEKNEVVLVLPMLTFLKYVAENPEAGLVLDDGQDRDSIIILGREEIFRILFEVRVAQKGLPAAGTFDKEFLFVKKGSIHQRLECRIQEHFRDINQETFRKLCDEWVCAAVYNLSLRMATTGSALCRTYATREVPGFGRVYLGYTNMWEAVLEQTYQNRFAKVRNILERTLEDGMDGLMINAFSQDSRCLLTKDNIRYILQYANEYIDRLGPQERAFFRNEM